MNRQINNKHILWLILVVAALLRFYDALSIPFTHDEFSALFRTRFDSLAALLKKGVKPDGHPAGVQVFLYYLTSWFGYKPIVVKLPFLFAGLGSIILFYQIGRVWYNETVGLIGASFLATMQYTVMYSQIARPYISGLFLTLAAAYFWSRLMQPSLDKKKWASILLFVLAGTLCAYNHYFSLLFLIILGLLGVFIIPRKRLLVYCISGIVIFILFLPHFNIFLHQLSIGGVGGWLHKPRPHFFFDYAGYIFNFSGLEYLLVAILILLGLWKHRDTQFSFRKWLIFLGLFLIPILVGYFYSVNYSAVLQFSVLIFSTPYLFFILFGHTKELKPTSNLILVLTIISVNAFALVEVRDHYSIFYNSVYSHILTDLNEVRQKEPNTAALLFTDPQINTWYLHELELDSTYTTYQSLEGIPALIALLEKESLKTDKFYLGATSAIDPRIVPLIRAYYPKLEQQRNYFTGTTFLFSKSTLPIIKKDHAGLNFDDSLNRGWKNIDTEYIIDSFPNTNSNVYFVPENTEWSISYSSPLDSIIIHSNDFIDISVRAFMPDSSGNALLVGTLKSGEKDLSWGASSFKDFKLKSDSAQWFTVYYSIKLSDIDLHADQIQFNCFVWNKNNANFYLDDFKISRRKGNPIIYGLYEPIPSHATLTD